MKKIFNKLILIVFVIFIGFSITACNQNTNREYKTNISSEDTALFTLFSFDGKGEGKFGIMNLGHSFFSIENTTTEDIVLAGKTIQPGETIAFGAWSILAKFGIWYNVESNYIRVHDKYNGRISITIGINNDDIEKISNYIKNNDTWNPIKNCSNFAITVWNMVALETEKISKPLIYTPTHICNEIKKFDNFEKNKEIPTDNNIGYFSSPELSWKFEEEV